MTIFGGQDALQTRVRDEMETHAKRMNLSAHCSAELQQFPSTAFVGNGAVLAVFGMGTVLAGSLQELTHRISHIVGEGVKF